MNLALWLYRAGLSHPDLPAAASGTRVVATYGELAARAARLAGALRERLGLDVGRPRRHRRQECARLYRAAVRHLARGARRGAGQCQTAWRRAWLHPRTIGRARLLCLGRHRRRDRGARAQDARTIDRGRQRRIRRTVCGRSDRRGAARARRSRLAVLHLGHHRTAEGRHAQPSGAGAGQSCLRRRGGSDRRRAMRSCTPRP